MWEAIHCASYYKANITLIAKSHTGSTEKKSYKLISPINKNENNPKLLINQILKHEDTSPWPSCIYPRNENCFNYKIQLCKRTEIRPFTYPSHVFIYKNKKKHLKDEQKTNKSGY